MTRADLWFDPICPWAWVVSRWLTEVERVRDVHMRLHIMSLAVLNEPRSVGAASDPAGAYATWASARVVAVTGLSFGRDAVRNLYTALGPLIHVERMPVGRDLFALALGRAGLPHSLANAAADPHYDAHIRASHHAGADPLGDIAACPVINLPGPDGAPVGFVGPLVTPFPTGDAAGRLWDAVAQAAATEGFFSLRRVITRQPDLT